MAHPNDLPSPTPTSDAARAPGRRRPFGALAFRVLFVTVFFLVMLELALRLVGFENYDYIRRVYDQRSGRVVAEFRPDEYAQWAPEPGSGAFNSGGFIGAEIPQERSPNTLRIACLGDSCTQEGSPAYPARLDRRLAERGYSVETMNWGVAGYTSTQGLARLRYSVLPYQPDIYTIYFGWNDHWIQNGIADHPMPRGRLWRGLEQSRVTQAARLVHSTLRRGGQAVEFRVPIDTYRRNLHEMIQLAREANGKVLLITAPGCLIDDRPLDRLLIGIESTGYSNAKDLHADYVEATRQVGKEAGADVLDLAHYFEHEVDGCAYFVPEKDPVHLVDAGLELIAAQIALRLIENGWLDGTGGVELTGNE